MWVGVWEGGGSLVCVCKGGGGVGGGVGGLEGRVVVVG